LCLSGICQSHHCRERVRITHSQICQHLAVEQDPVFLHTVYQATVGSPIQPGCRIDPCDPQSPQIALACPTVSIRIPQAFQHGFIRPPEQTMAGPKLAFHHLQDFMMMLAAVRSSLNTSHFLPPAIPRTPAADLPVECTPRSQCSNVFLSGRGQLAIRPANNDASQSS